MNKLETQIDTIQYTTSGTCCKLMQIKLFENVIQNVEFFGGCAGNLLGLKSLLSGMTIDEVITKFRGIKCGDKNTSCPDQLAQCLMEYKANKK